MQTNAKISIISVNSVLYSMLLVLAFFLYTYNDETNSIMFSFALTLLGISGALNSILKEKWEKTADEKKQDVI